MSSLDSVPTDKRTKSFVAPDASCSSSVNCWCVVLAGCMISDLESPTFANKENKFSASTNSGIASESPLTPNVKIAPWPLGKYLVASS